MKAYLLLLLLVPLCTAQKFTIRCYGQDFYMVNNVLLVCNSETEQACYTKQNGEKGCITLDYCSTADWNCCYTNDCNA